MHFLSPPLSFSFNPMHPFSILFPLAEEWIFQVFKTGIEAYLIKFFALLSLIESLGVLIEFGWKKLM